MQKLSSSNPPPIQSLVHLLRTGQFDALARQAADCAARWPASAPVWHLLGLAHLNRGCPADAISPLTRASKLMPQEPEVQEQLAIALMQAGRLKEAYRAFERCLALAPDHQGLLVNLAHLANDQGNYGAAESHCRRALQLAPGQAEALFNLGRALRGQGKDQDAIAAFQEAVGHARNSAVAQNDVGLQLKEMGAETEAEACFRQAIALAPGYARAHSNLGLILQARGRMAEALTCLQKAATLEPNLPAVHANLASLYNSMREFGRAEAASRQALGLDSRLAIGYCNLADALVGQRHYEKAEESFRQALKLQPANSDASNNLGNLLQELKRFDEAIACYRRIKDDDGTALGNIFHCSGQLWDWSQRERDEQALRTILTKDTACVGPFGLLAMTGDQSPELQKRAGRLYADKVFRTALAQPPLVAPEHHGAGDRLRIGYLSADFHDHATMHLLGGVLACHDRKSFAIHLYSYGPDSQDKERQRALAAAETFRDLGSVTDEAAAQQIAADAIDILVDLKGYTQDTRLGITALRPAPVIVSWLGYPGTLGHARLADYIIGDPVVTPPEHACHYSETLALMPHCYQPNDRNREIGPRPSRLEAGLPEEGFVFCSFNQSFKLNPEVFDVWCQLLKAVPGSVLWLLKPTEPAMANLRREAAARGVEPTRLVFADKKPLTEHLGRLQLADLALDTYPYGSHTTGSDALWVGVPMVTKTGDTFASRVGASLLAAVDLTELATRNWDDYLALARELALQPPKLAALRDRLANRRLTAPLFDTARFTRDLERLYQGIWQQHGRGERELLQANP